MNAECFSPLTIFVFNPDVAFSFRCARKRLISAGGRGGARDCQNTNAEYCSPLTSFDWCEADPSTVGTSSIDTTCTIWDVTVSMPVFCGYVCVKSSFYLRFCPAVCFFFHHQCTYRFDLPLQRCPDSCGIPNTYHTTLTQRLPLKKRNYLKNYLKDNHGD